MEGPHLLKDVHVLTPILPIFLSDLGVIRNTRSEHDAAEHLWVKCKSGQQWHTLPTDAHKIIFTPILRKIDGVLKV
jgi:hypothetical protein